MISNEGINYSLRNLMHSKSRSFLTVFSILVGITTLFLFVSFGLGLFAYIDEIMSDSSANKLMIQARGSGGAGLDTTFKLTDDDVDSVLSVPGVDEVTGSYIGPGAIRQDGQLKYVFAVSYDPKKPLMMEISDIDVEEGRWLRNPDTRKVLLGYNFKKDDTIFPEGYELGDKINLEGVDHRIVGFLGPVGNPQDDSNVYLTNDYFEELYNETDSYSYIIVESNEGDLDPVIEKIEDKLRRERNQEEGKEDFYVQSFEDLINSFSGALNIIIGFILLIAVVSVIVSMVNTANTMVTSVLERFKEIGILKAIGAKNSEVFSIFLFESSFLGFIAGCIGVFFGWLFAFLAGSLLEALNYGFLSPTYSGATGFILNFINENITTLVPAIPSGTFAYDLFVYCILFATITGGLSGVFPAYNASRINTVDALRYE